MKPTKEQCIELMAGAMRGTRAPSMSGLYAPDAYDYTAKKAYNALEAAGVFEPACEHPWTRTTPKATTCQLCGASAPYPQPLSTGASA